MPTYTFYPHLKARISKPPRVLESLMVDTAQHNPQVPNQY
jgi:hypothetical protein